MFNMVRLVGVVNKNQGKVIKKICDSLGKKMDNIKVDVV